MSPEGPTFEAGAPQALFEVETPEAIAPYPTHYAVTADGQRFLVNTVIGSAGQAGDHSDAELGERSEALTAPCHSR